MNKTVFLFLIIISCSQGKAQNLSKPVIDSAAINDWPSLDRAGISPDGMFVYYMINNQPVDCSTLVLRSVEGSWEKTWINKKPIGFTADSRQFIYKSGDTLAFVKLGTDDIKYLNSINNFRQSQRDNQPWLAYQLKTDKASKLILFNLLTEKEIKFDNVSDYFFDDYGTRLFIDTNDPHDSLKRQQLMMFRLKDGTSTFIWKGSKEEKPVRFLFGKDSIDFAFMVQESKGGTIRKSIWYYAEGMSEAIEKINDYTPGIESGWAIHSLLKVESEIGGTYIFFDMLPQPEKPDPNKATVDVWSYQDKVLQNYQLRENIAAGGSIFSNNRSGVMKIDNNKVVLLRRQLDEQTDLSQFHTIFDNNYVPIWRRFSIYKFWQYKKDTVWLESLDDGKRILVPIINYIGEKPEFSVSPQGTYLIYFDLENQHYFALDVKTLRARDISAGISFVHINSFPTWLKDESRLLVCDDYDIWSLDPMGKIAPVNLTHGYGRKHNLWLRLAEWSKFRQQGGIPNGHLMILTAFDKLNKNTGLFKLNMNSGELQKLCLNSEKTEIVQKADNADAWIVKRQTASEAPNYYLTKDLQHFTKLTNLNPQKQYNWLTSEVINFRKPDSKTGQAILYKPEDFDPKKKYPVLFNYYESRTQETYLFPAPFFTGGTDIDIASPGANINIPWFVSRGYLICVPDITYTIGETGKSAYNSVVGAAKYLAKLPYVDAKRMGIQGHSFGGFETDYIVTHSNLFKAACTASGISDIISEYLGSLIADQNFVEGDQGRMGKSLWEAKESYIDNSAIFSADKVTTPVLIMHNKDDGQVDWSQGIELFKALRRLDKKVWLLAYDEEGHVIYKEKNQIDYAIRMTQFFDHYLKGAPMPKWMSGGIPAIKKGIDMGYELDYAHPNGN